MSAPGTGLEIHVGRNVNTPDGFRILLDGRDVTESFRVRSLRLAVDPESGPTVVELHCYVDEATILPDHAQVHVVREPISPAEGSSPAG